MIYISCMQRIAVFVLLFVLLGCKKEPTTWNTSNSAPLLRASLGINDLVADSLLETGDDDLVSIVYSTEIFSFGIDSLVEVVEDTVTNSFSIFPIAELEVTSGQQFFNQSEIVAFEQVDAALSRAVVSAGDLKLTASSDISGDLLFRVIIPEAKKNGFSFEFEAIIPAGSQSDPSIVIESTDMEGYDLNLTGSNGSEFNEIEIISSLIVPEYEEQVTILAANEVSMEITFEGLEVDFVEGYLGSEEFEFDEKSQFENIPELSDAMLNLSDASLDLSISNGFGVDLQALIFNFRAENGTSGDDIDLNHNIIGSTINLSRADIHQGVINPSEKNYLIDQDNSNLIDLLEIIPDSFEISGRAELNPLGNISNYNDFASSASEFKCTAQIEIPLFASFSNLVLREISNIDWGENSEISKTLLYLHANSTFHANTEISLLLVDDAGNELMDLSELLIDNQVPLITGAKSDQPSITTLVFEFNEQDINVLQQANEIITELRFETTNYPELVEIRSTDKIDILISADIDAQLEF